MGCRWICCGAFGGAASVTAEEFSGIFTNRIEILPSSASIVKVANIFWSQVSVLGLLVDIEQVAGALSAHDILEAGKGQIDIWEIQQVGGEFGTVEGQTNVKHEIKGLQIDWKVGKERNGRNGDGLEEFVDSLVDGVENDIHDTADAVQDLVDGKAEFLSAKFRKSHGPPFGASLDTTREASASFSAKDSDASSAALDSTRVSNRDPFSIAAEGTCNRDSDSCRESFVEGVHNT